MYYRCVSRSLSMSMDHTTQNQGREISDTVEFRHQIITTPVVTPEDRILHEITTLIYFLMDAPTYQSDAQLQAITALLKSSSSWESPDETPTPTATILLPSPDQTRQSIIVQKMMMKHPKLQHPVPPPANSKGAKRTCAV